MVPFNFHLNFKKIDFRFHPELYRIGRGEQGVLLIEPYKSELLPFWKFKTPQDAKISARIIYNKFLTYKKEMDFAGMDMARKFLQMGFTRSRRYANHKTGKKYDGPVPEFFQGISGSHGRRLLPPEVDPLKAESAAIFKKAWDKAEKDRLYRSLKSDWGKWYG